MNPDPATPSTAESDRLDSWKAIAAFLGRDISTVRRWEKTEGMPVHRHLHSARGSAYAYKSELNGWFDTRRMNLADVPLETPLLEPPPPGAPAKTQFFRPYGIIFLLPLVAAGAVWRFEAFARPPAGSSFQPRDWVIVADVDNRTGDARFDDTIRFALERELSESRFLNVAPQSRIEDTLQLMRRPLDSRIDRATAIEVALRDGGIRGILLARLDRFDPARTLSVVVIDPAHSGQTIAATTTTVSSAAELPDAIRRVSDRIRQVLGERAMGRTGGHRLERVTTRSLRALELFTEGKRAVDKLTWPVAAPLLEQAVVEDPAFAYAEIMLAWALRNMRRPAAEYQAHAQKAADASRHAGDRERYFILGSFHEMLGDDATAASMYETLVALYPDDYWGLNNLVNLYQRAGRRDDARRISAQIARTRPNSFTLAIRAAIATHYSGAAIADVDAMVRHALTLDRSGSSPFELTFTDFFPAYQAWVRNDPADVIAQLKGLDTKSWYHAHMAAGFELALGRLVRADALYQTAPAKGDRLAYRALIALYRGESVASLSAARQAVAEDVTSSALVLRWLLLRSGETALHERLIARNATDDAKAARDMVQLERSTARALASSSTSAPDVDDIERYLLSIRPGSGAYFRFLELEADVLLRRGDTHRAAALLRDATASRERALFGGEIFSGAPWIRARAKLADVYRRLGRVDDADAIDAELRRWLAFADRDFTLR